MTRYLLDTNIISNVVKPMPSESLLIWLGAQIDTDLFISTLTLGEIQRGILEKPAGAKRRTLENWFSGPDGPQVLFAGRILPFDVTAARHWAELMAAGTATSRPRSAIDTMIAAIARAYDCVVVTDNEKDFAGVDSFNPMREA